MLLTLQSCSSKKNKFVIKRVSYDQLKLNELKEQFNSYNQPKTITVWIHGTKFSNIFFKKIYLPKLTHAINSFPSYKIYTIANILSKYDHSEYQFESFYIFGWSGLLSWQEREKACKYLYKYLKNLIQEFKNKYNYIPKINIITHSHGGNVALNLAKIKNINDNELAIDKLILLACPVQKRTKDLIKDSTIFKNVYSFYSTLDAMQILDPQGFHRIDKAEIQPIKKKGSFFSRRRFDSSENLRQAKIKINGRGILHSEFLMKQFLSILPSLIHEIDSYKRADPGNKSHKDYLFSVNLET